MVCERIIRAEFNGTFKLLRGDAPTPIVLPCGESERRVPLADGLVKSYCLPGRFFGSRIVPHAIVGMAESGPGKRIAGILFDNFLEIFPALPRRLLAALVRVVKSLHVELVDLRIDLPRCR